jgi:DNA-binding transcriptional MerR regulator
LASYSIKDLEFLSGIKAHTIRVWEQRYNILCPKRTETNIRYYLDEDLKHLLNVSLLYEHNYKISAIAKMALDDLNEKVQEIAESHTSKHTNLNALMVAMMEMDEDRFEKVLSTHILQNGFEQTIINLVYPFLEKIGILWRIESINPAHEHFISNLIRQKIIVAIDGQIKPEMAGAKKYLLFLPEYELHEIGLLFSNFLIKSRNQKVVYLGTSVPLEDVKKVYDIHKPDYIFSIFSANPGSEQLQDYVNFLANNFAEATVLLTGWQALNNQYEVPANVKLIKNLDELIDFVEQNRVYTMNLENS